MRVLKIAENVELAGDETKCAKCGHVLGPTSQNWKKGAVRRSRGSEMEETLLKLSNDLAVFEYLCPSCGTLLDVEIARKTEEPLWDVELKRGRRR